MIVNRLRMCCQTLVCQTWDIGAIKNIIYQLVFFHLNLNISNQYLLSSRNIYCQMIFRKSLFSLISNHLLISYSHTNSNIKKTVATNSFIAFNKVIVKDKLTIDKPKVSPIQLTLDYISTLTTLDVTDQKLLEIQAKIANLKVNRSQNTSIIKFLMSTLYKLDIPTEMLINNDTIAKMIKNDPYIELEGVMFIISREMMKKEKNIELINNLYLKSFQNLLPKVEDNFQKLKCEVLLYKNFGKHLIQNGYKQKGLNLIFQSVDKHNDLISEQHKRVERLKNGGQEQQRKSESQKERDKLQVNVMKENIRRLIQSMLQTLYFYYVSKIQTLKSNQQKSLFSIQISNLISKSMRVRSIMPGFHLYSRYFHKLNQIHLEVDYAQALMKRDRNKVTEVKMKMKDFIKNCYKDIQVVQNKPQMYRQISLAILNLQLHLIKSEGRKTAQEMKNQLLEVGVKIVELGKMEEKKVQKQIITKLLNDFLNKNFK